MGPPIQSLSRFFSNGGPYLMRHPLFSLFGLFSFCWNHPARGKIPAVFSSSPFPRFWNRESLRCSKFFLPTSMAPSRIDGSFLFFPMRFFLVWGRPRVCGEWISSNAFHSFQIRPFPRLFGTRPPPGRCLLWVPHFHDFQTCAEARTVMRCLLLESS